MLVSFIVRQWPEMNYFNEKPHDPITLDVYVPSAASHASSFVLYEDDGLTREFERGASAQQTFNLTGTSSSFTLSSTACTGSYHGKPKQRAYIVTAHTTQPATGVAFNK